MECMQASSWTAEHPNMPHMHIFYDNLVLMFKIIGSGEQGYILQWKQAWNSMGDHFLLLRDDGHRVLTSESDECYDAVDEASWYLSFTMFSTLHFLVQKPASHRRRRGARRLAAGGQVPAKKK